MTTRLPRYVLPPVFVLAAVFSIAVSGPAAQSVPEREFLVSGTVTGASGSHPVYVALWDESGFLKKPVQQVEIKPGGDTGFHFRVSGGQWAVSAYEDMNENGKLDMGMFGPKEPNGFFRPFHQWHKPRFAEVSFQVSQNTPNADIALRH